ncbi:type IV toxin-antitoxin system AbiEi family antitoxin domain-containing protein [Cupriavidus pauculus]|uniref:Transcriptional regulator AbiEi antitoxin N-terminal domain-containing protein n=1 Tax=Cupriavidus pauculus TaxID=82633 RepID=A0A2N5CE19_9BURK|nr:type IV toxin-antitoxin system AbiEi family antitoxin domain-containing protein [Cupriavidus pauculus]PLQ00437.1 hypothetical protein CYJ10_12505 [Cupriavidus pauculus]
MGKENLQRLMELAPRGQPLDPDLLRDMRVSSRATSYLLEAGWLQRLSKGAYLLRGDKPTREGMVAFVSRKMPGLHIGGKSALTWHATQKVSATTERIGLWGPRPYRFPSWLAEHLDFMYQTTDLFDGHLPYAQGLISAPHDPGVMVSVPERALLELASDAGKTLTVQALENAMSLASDLRPSVLDQLLSHCTRVKVIKLVRDIGRRGSFSWADTAEQHVDRLGADKRWSYASKNGERLTLD